MGHVLYSPSKLEKYECCPSFRQDQTDTVNPAAEEGTLLHKAAETRDHSALTDADQIELVTRCNIVEDNIVGSYGPGTTVLREVFVRLQDLTQGTVDLAVFSPKENESATIVDWKFGKIPVTQAETNVQGQAYAAAVMEMYPKLEKVDVMIFQPRLDLNTTYRYYRSDLERIRLRIMSIIARAQVPEGSREETPSEKACMYCTRKSECKALKSIAEKVGHGLNLPVPVNLSPTGMVRPKDMAKMQILSHILEDWATQVRQRNAKLAIEDGVEVPGFEIRSREGAYSVTDLVSVVELMRSSGLPLENILQACSVSLPKLTDQLVAVKGGKKKEVREGLEDKIKAYLVRGERVTFLQKKKGMTYEDIIKECRD